MVVENYNSNVRLILVMVFYCGTSFLLSGCDHSVYARINSQRTYTLESNCSSIEITGQEFSKWIGLRFKTRNDLSDIKLNPKSLKLSLVDRSGSGSVITKYDFAFYRHKKKETVVDEVTLDSGQIVALDIYFSNSIPKMGPESYLQILPSNVLTCKGQAIIMDTIVVK